jgi:hypothetical protein
LNPAVFFAANDPAPGLLISFWLDPRLANSFDTRITARGGFAGIIFLSCSTNRIEMSTSEPKSLGGSQQLTSTIVAAGFSKNSLLGIGDDPAGRKILPQYLPKSQANARPEVEILLDAPPDRVVSQSGRRRRWPSEPKPG